MVRFLAVPLILISPSLGVAAKWRLEVVLPSQELKVYFIHPESEFKIPDHGTGWECLVTPGKPTGRAIARGIVCEKGDVKATSVLPCRSDAPNIASLNVADRGKSATFILSCHE